jgi:peptidoglycan/LPS O-acetylase OafA/YrhL
MTPPDGAAPAGAGPGLDVRRVVREQIPALDGVRALALLLVLAHNFNVPYATRHGLAHGLELFMDWGWVGVQLFFVLSGFLITGILLDTRSAPNYYRSFYARRTLRIFPLYYATLIFGLVILPRILGHPLPGHEHQIWLWLYLSNWASALLDVGVYGFGPFWSLAVEEQFYLLWPLVVRRLSSRVFLSLCILLMAAALAARVVCRAHGLSADAVYELTFCRIDALALGAVGALLLRTPAAAAWIERNTMSLSFGSLLAFLLGAWATRGYPRLTVPTQTFGFTVLAWCFGVLVVGAVVSQARGGPLARLFSLPPLRAIGRYSYAMYVFHDPLFENIGRPLLARWHPGPYPVPIALSFFVVMTAATFALAWCSYRVLERPFLRLKDRFVAVRS